MARTGPQGVHYFDRDTGLNLLVEETTTPNEGEWSVAPRTLSVALSNACDCSCPHCFAPKMPAALDLDRVVEWASEFDLNGGQNLGFGGGEPTLVPGLPRLCRAITESCKCAVTLTTHGLNFDDALAGHLSGSVHFIRVSVGGIETLYEETFGRPFAKLLSAIPAIKSVAPMGFNCLVTSATLPYLDEVLDFACEHGAVELLLLPEVGRDGSVRLNSSERELLAAWIAQRAQQYPLSLSAHAQGVLHVEALPIGDPRGDTYDFLHIDAEATLKRSAFDYAGVPMGSDGLIPAIARLRTMLTEGEAS